MTELSDELLAAYVDGQLARDQSRAVKRVLDNDVVAAQRARALKAAHQRLETAFDSILAGEFSALTGMMPPSHIDEADLQAAMPAEPPRGTGKLVLLAALMALGVGSIGGYVARGQMMDLISPTADEIAAPLAPSGEADGEAGKAASVPEAESGPPSATLQQAEAAPPVTSTPSPDPLHTGSLPREETWRDDAERAFSLYSRNSLEVSLDSQANRDFVSFQLGKALGTDLALPDLSGQGLAFKRLEILQHDGVPLAQMLYLPQKGAPVALYAKRGETEGSTPTTLHATGRVGMASWSDGKVDFLLAGRLPEKEITILAKAIRDQSARN